MDMHWAFESLRYYGENGEKNNSNNNSSNKKAIGTLQQVREKETERECGEKIFLQAMNCNNYYPGYNLVHKPSTIEKCSLSHKLWWKCAMETCTFFGANVWLFCRNHSFVPKYTHTIATPLNETALKLSGINILQVQMAKWERESVRAYVYVCLC